MVRSWEERVKGASTKAEVAAPEHIPAPEPPPAPVSFSTRPVRREPVRNEQEPSPTPGIETPTEKDSSEPESPTDRVELSGSETVPVTAPSTFTPSSTWVPAYDVTPMPKGDPAFGMALAHAVSAARMPVVIVGRKDGNVIWASEAWLERFGPRDSFSRYAPTSTDYGEAPLPPPGESWQRTRTLTLANGGEDLVELLLLGGESGGAEVVTVMARDRLSATPLVSDLSEVVAVVDSLILDAADDTVAVIYIDIDRFKVVHDLVGNLEAQRLLDKVGRRIATSVREGDLLYRMPGDEFVVLAAGLESPQDAAELAERLRACVAGMSDIGHEMAVTASVGVAYCREGHNGESTLSDAETAVYVAKGRGRNRVAIHDDELRTRSDRLLAVERQLRRAIDRRQVQFAYQPLIEISSGRIVGAEALLRLGRDIGLSAVEVVAAAEQSGLMGVLGALVVDGVREQLGDWLAGDDDRLIMVNVSANQLADGRLLRTLAALVNDPEVRAARFAIEIPESAILENRAAFDRLVEEVRPKVKVGIDSFGARIASVAELGDLPVDYVKLHRSLTSLFAGSGEGLERASELVQSVVASGRSVIALGVEQEEQAVALQAAGCGLAQGFYYAGAVSVDELRERDRARANAAR